MPCASLALVVTLLLAACGASSASHASVASIPPDWVDGAASAELMVGPLNATAAAYLPEVGNGYLATKVGSGIAYLAGA